MSRSRHNCENGHHMRGRLLPRLLFDGQVLVLCILPYNQRYVVSPPLSISVFCIGYTVICMCRYQESCSKHTLFFRPDFPLLTQASGINGANVGTRLAILMATAPNAFTLSTSSA